MKAALFTLFAWLNHHFTRILGILALVVIAVTAGFIVRGPQPQIDYTQMYYTPDGPRVEGGRVALCPGGVLEYTPALQLKSAGEADIKRQFWSDTIEQPAVTKAGTSPAIIEITRIYPFHLAGRYRSNTVQIVVPDFPPGEYRLITVAKATNGAAAQYEVEFTVPATCKSP